MSQKKSKVIIKKVVTAYENLMEAVAAAEDSRFDNEEKKELMTVLEKIQIHNQIALEHIQG